MSLLLRDPEVWSPTVTLPLAICRRLFRVPLLSVAALIGCAVVSPAVQADPHIPSYERFHASEPSADAGMLLMGELNCVACHQADAKTLQRLASKHAPLLDGVAQRIKPSYLEKYIADAHTVKPGATMPDLFGGVSAEERARQTKALAHFLVSQSKSLPAQSYAPRGGREMGEILYESVGCAVCHGSRKEGVAALPTDKPLGDLQAKYTLPALSAFLQDPLHTRPSGRMPSLNLSGGESRAIASFLLPNVPEKSGLAFKYYEGKWKTLPDFETLTPKVTGEAEKIDVSVRKRDADFALRFEGALAIDQPGEYTFHTRSDDGSRVSIDGKVVASNDGIHPASTKSGKVKLTKGRHQLIVDYFEAGGEEVLKVEFEGPGVKRQDISGAVLSAAPETPIEPIEFKVDAELASAGQKLFASIGCASCHALPEKSGGSPIASSLMAPALAEVKPENGCLSTNSTKQPANYHLNAGQQESIKAALTSLVSQKSPPAKQQILNTMTQLNCVACHQRDEIGGPLEEQLELFTGTQKEMGDEGRLPPLLDGVGGKLTDQWLAHTLAEGANDRPYMHTRMPKFGKENAGHLQALLASTDKLDPLPEMKTNVKEAKKAGWQMVGKNGFGCISCHTFGRYKATGVQSIDLTIMHKRLRPEWFRRYVDDPIKFRKGTRMPDAWPNSSGVSMLNKLLDGKNETQIAAVWTYLGDGARARTPAGLVTNSMELIPSNEAIIYRNFIQDAGPRAIGVGYPEQYSLAFDANNLRIALLWQGAFIDAAKHWSGRGQGFQGPAGQNVLKLPAETTVAILENGDADWPKGDPRKAGVKFRGYRLSEDRRPTFLYEVNGVKVHDFPNAVEAGVTTRFERTLSLTSEKPRNDVYILGAVGDIKAEADGWYSVAGQYRVRFEGGEVSIRENGGRKELLVHVKLKGDAPATIIQQYDW